MPGAGDIIRVLIASPSGLDDERKLVKRLVNEAETSLPITAPLAFRVLRWEDEPPDYGRPQEVLNPMAQNCAVFIGLLADQFGSPTGEAESGFLEEYEIVLERRRNSSNDFPRIWLFFKTGIDEGAVDADQYAKVTEFKETIKSERIALYREFADEPELEEKVRLALSRLVQQLFSVMAPLAPELIGKSAADLKI